MLEANMDPKAILERPRSHLERLGGVLGRLGGVLGGLGRILGDLGDVLGRLGGLFEASWKPRQAMMAPRPPQERQTLRLPIN